jgi:hypothetical protein
MLPPTEPDEIPVFLDRLSDDDRLAYEVLKERVSSPDNRYTRFRRLATLKDCFDEIRAFCIRHDDGDSLRCLVCGIYWFDTDELAINTRQLRLLLAKSKSSINGALAKMKYITRPTKERERDRLIAALPELRGDWLEVRQWTIRMPTSTQVEGPVWVEPQFVEPEERETNWEISEFDFGEEPIMRDSELEVGLGCFLQFCAGIPGIGQPQDLFGVGFPWHEQE